MFDFKNLINSMVKRQSPASISSPTAESATKLVQKLPQDEYFGAHIEIIKAIGRLNKDENTPLEERIQTLLYVDERTFPIHRTICEEFFKPENTKRNYLPAILAYVNELATGYYQCLFQYLAHNAPKELLPSISLVAIRGLVHHNQQVFWYALRYTEPQHIIWKQAYLCYNFIEKLKLHRLPMKVYNSVSGSETIPEHVLLHSAFLKIGNTSALNMQEIRQLHYILGQACKKLQFSQQADSLAEPVFMIDFSNEEAPHLYRRGGKPEASRFWSGQECVDAVGLVIDRIVQNKALEDGETLPEYVVDDPHKNLPQHWEGFFQKIRKCLLEPEYQAPPVDMELAAEEVFVTTGFNLIAFKSKQDLTIPTERERQESRWIMTAIGKTTIDLSNFAKECNLFIGDTILVEFLDSLPVLGVISRMVKKDGGENRITMDIIGSSPIAINLFDPTNPTASYFGLYVTHDNSNLAKRVLLIPNNLVRPNKKIELSTSGQSYMIQLQNIDMQYNECSCCQFTAVAKQK